MKSVCKQEVITRLVSNFLREIFLGISCRYLKLWITVYQHGINTIDPFLVIRSKVFIRTVAPHTEVIKVKIGCTCYKGQLFKPDVKINMIGALLIGRGIPGSSH
jgi:hypothetical protein